MKEILLIKSPNEQLSRFLSEIQNADDKNKTIDILTFALDNQDFLQANVLIELISQFSHTPTNKSIEVLESIVSNTNYDENIRIESLHVLSTFWYDGFKKIIKLVIEENSGHLDLKACALEKIGYNDFSEELRSLIFEVLKSKISNPKLIFWAIYAASDLEGDIEAIKLVDQYKDDHREVNPMTSNATKAKISEEASWAVERMNGVISDPSWMK
tara:strand:+ start:977 stop:1618 length:642 start_codon:yes stop_codon:yes gene_type:complete